MRNVQQLEVDAHTSAIRAADRARANRRLQGVFDGAPESEPWWKRYFKWETLTVAGRTIEKGWVVPQPLGVALIIFILGASLTTLGSAAALYWRVTDAVGAQANETRELREIVIRLDERMIQKDNNDKERNNDIRQQIEGVKSHQAAIESVMNKEISLLKNRR